MHVEATASAASQGPGLALTVAGSEGPLHVLSSVEVEVCLCEHPSVLEAAVVGMPDDKWGEVPRAYVTLRPGAPAVDGPVLIAWVRERLAHFKAPARVDIVDELPKGGTGKIQKAKLREQ